MAAEEVKLSTFGLVDDAVAVSSGPPPADVPGVVEDTLAGNELVAAELDVSPTLKVVFCLLSNFLNLSNLSESILQHTHLPSRGKALFHLIMLDSNVYQSIRAFSIDTTNGNDNDNASVLH